MRNYLEDQVQRIGKEGIPARAEMLVGNPASKFIGYVENNPTQLIAMSTHGHAGISRMIFGSFAENILHLVKKTPMLLVKPPEEM
jgi:nucleotide-binding universal stress UspA family protein